MGLANRGVAIGAGDWPREDLALVWSVRGAPHAYRRPDLPGVEAALRPLSPADARRRVRDADEPLRAAGIPADVALATVAAHLRRIVVEPMAKGTASARLTAVVPGPYRRPCRSCGTVHVPEPAFRLGALHAGLELEPGTSPPVLRPVPHWRAGHAGTVTHGTAPSPPRLDPVRGYLHHLGPARPADVAGYLDAPVADVTARWPDDAVGVDVDGERRWVLAGDEDALAAAADPDGAPARTVRLLGPFDLFLQGRDRDTLVPAPAHRPALWPALGRPGAVLVDGEVVGTWRPRVSGSALSVVTDRWVPWGADVDAAVRAEAERLAEHRGADRASVVEDDRRGVTPRRPPA